MLTALLRILRGGEREKVKTPSMEEIRAGYNRAVREKAEADQARVAAKAAEIAGKIARGKARFNDDGKLLVVADVKYEDGEAVRQELAITHELLFRAIDKQSDNWLRSVIVLTPEIEQNKEWSNDDDRKYSW